MKNVKQAQVTHIFCENYIEIALLENGAPGSQRCVAEDFEKAKRGDLVEVKPAAPWDEPIAKLAYLASPALFLLGMIAGGRLALPERLLAAALLALLGLCVGWLMNRRARLRRRLEYRVVRVTQRADCLRNPSA